MPKMNKIVVTVLLLSSILAGCHTLSSSNRVHEKKATAASINVQLGMAYLERHEIQRAKQKLLLALHENPQLPEAWYSLGYFFEITGDQQKASQYYLKSIELAPKRGDTNNNYGTYLCRNHHYNEAIKHFLIATQDVEYLDTAAAFENAGLCAELIPVPDLAEKYFVDALKQDPNRPTALLSLAQLYYQQEKYDQANRYLNQFLAISAPTAESLALAQQLKRKGERVKDVF
jgi:type IV pilus assembly protein PilF